MKLCKKCKQAIERIVFNSDWLADHETDIVTESDCEFWIHKQWNERLINETKEILKGIGERA